MEASLSQTASPWQDSKVLAQGIVWLLSSVALSRVLGCGVAHLSSSATLQDAMPNIALFVTSHITSEGRKGKQYHSLLLLSSTIHPPSNGEVRRNQIPLVGEPQVQFKESFNMLLSSLQSAHRNCHNWPRYLLSWWLS